MLRRPISMQPSSPASVSQILHLPMDSFIHHPSHPYSPVLTPSETKGARSHSTLAGTFDLIDYHAYAAKQLPSEALRTDVASSLLLCTTWTGQTGTSHSYPSPISSIQSRTHRRSIQTNSTTHTA